MSIFFWFLIIAVATLALNTTVILQMRKRRAISVFPIFAILCAGYLAAALLYLLTSMHGTQILEQKQAARLDIEPQSYQTASDGAHASYAFCSREGISFHFSDTDLLAGDVPPQPSEVEIYFCRIRTGFSACYLSEGTAVRYLLR